MSAYDFRGGGSSPRCDGVTFGAWAAAGAATSDDSSAPPATASAAATGCAAGTGAAAATGGAAAITGRVTGGGCCAVATRWATADGGRGDTRVTGRVSGSSHPASRAQP